MLSRRCHAVLAVPVVYELLGGVVQRAGAVLAGKVVAVQLPLIGRGAIGGSSAAVLGRLLIYLLITAFWLALRGNDGLCFELGSEVLHALVLDLRLQLLLGGVLLLLLVRIVLFLRRTLVFHAFAFVLDVAQ